VLAIEGVATGTCIVIVDGSGERTMFPDPGANSALTPEMVLAALDDTVDHVHVSGYTLLNPASRAAGLAVFDAARSHGSTISLDPASSGPLEAARDIILDRLPFVDVLLANAAEAAVLVGTDDPDNALSVLLESCPVVVIKLGPRGVIAGTRDERVQLPALAVGAVDSTGAGDAFAAGFLPVWLAGSGLTEAVRAGVGLGARAVSRVGAGPQQA
jgi:sugar/nucleoside kinase (ribokinase family)